MWAVDPMLLVDRGGNSANGVRWKQQLSSLSATELLGHGVGHVGRTPALDHSISHGALERMSSERSVEGLSGHYIHKVFVLVEHRLLRETLLRLLQKKSDIRVVGSGRLADCPPDRIIASECGIVLIDSVESAPTSKLIVANVCWRACKSHPIIRIRPPSVRAL